MSQRERNGSNDMVTAHRYSRPHRRLYLCIGLVWLFWFVTAALILSQHYLRVIHFACLPFVLLVLGMISASFGSVVLVNRSRRLEKQGGRAVVWIVLGITPPVLFVLPCVNAARRAVVPNESNSLVFQFASGVLGSAAEGYVGWAYPNRLETQRLVMFYDQLDAPQSDVSVMDQYVADLEERTGRPLREKIYWVRGPLFGIRYSTFRGFALGTPFSPDWDNGGNDLDRHELAHAVLEQYREPTADPPLFFDEGWAVSQSRSRSTSPEEYYALHLALQLSDQQRLQEIPRLPVLANREWYHNDVARIQIHHRAGGPLVAFLIREYGIKRFLLLYNTCRQDSFEADCRRVLGTDLQTLDQVFWEDIERTVREVHIKYPPVKGVP